MKYILLLFFFFSPSVRGQDNSNWIIEAFSGASSYNGDLVQGNFPLSRPALLVGGNIKYTLSPHFSLRGGVSFGSLYANDSKNKDPELIQRNLSFKTKLSEYSLGCEFNINSWEEYYYTPYLFAGVGIFNFNPYAFDKLNNKVFLQPICTEGQGLPDFPNRKKYALSQLCLPIGVGFKYELTNKITLSYEFDYHIIFTDYLDDVSSSYVSLDKLQETYGAPSAELSFRQDGVPFKKRLGEKRGDLKNRDVYYFTFLKLSTFL